MHEVTGRRDTTTTFPLSGLVDDAGERRQANRAVGVSAVGLAVTGVVELALALLSGSVALLGDALHNLSDVSTSAMVFVGFRASGKSSTETHPYGYERAEDIAGVGIAIVIWASAVLAAVESVRKLVDTGTTDHVWWGMAGAAVGIVGNQAVARYKLVVGRRINSATMVADAKHSWLDALSSAAALLGLIGVALGWRWADPVAGLIVTLFICHVGWEVSADVVRRLMDGVEPDTVARAEQAAMTVPGVQHAHVRARWTGRTLHVEVEGWVDSRLSVKDADDVGRSVAEAVAAELPEMRAFTWAARGV